MTSLTAEELNTLSSMRADARAGVIGYWEIYDWLADLLVEEKGVAPTDQTVLWLRGATEANADRGAMASLIRAYTSEQYTLRYGQSLPDADMQRASDKVAENLIEDILGESDDDWPIGVVPDINRIAKSDATAVGGPSSFRVESNADNRWS